MAELNREDPKLLLGGGGARGMMVPQAVGGPLPRSPL